MKKHQDGWGCVYSAINLSNGLEYIGKDKTGDPANHRWRGHCREAAKVKSKGYFQRALKKAGGFAGFEWSVIWRGSLEEMAAKEVYYIAKRHTWVGDPLCRGYNLTKGGEGMVGFKHSRRAKKRMSVAATRYFETEEGRKKTSEAGKRYFEENPEARKHLSNTRLLLFKNPAEHRKLSRAQLRRYESMAEHEKLRTVFNLPEVRKKKSDAQLRRFKDPNERAKISAALSKPSTKKKLSKRSISMWEARSVGDRTAIAQKTWATRHALDAADLIGSRKRYKDAAKKREDAMSKEARSKRAYKAWVTRRANITTKKVNL